VPNEGEPVESVEVEIKTGNERLAGTDDDVYLRLGRNLVFPLDKRIYDDFERGDRDTYSVPIDDAARLGMRVGDIRQVTIEKSRDGIAGGWRLAGVKLRVNGRVLYTNQRVNQWLEKGKRTWTASNFVHTSPRGQKIPVWIRLAEDDFLYGGDDNGDINPYDRRRTVSIGYAPGPPLERTTEGGGKLGGRLDDGEEARITYRLETLTPELITATQPEPTPPPPGPKPDLIITAFTSNGVTVQNIGAGAAGPFRLRASNAMVAGFQYYDGLEPGESEARPLELGSCFQAYVANVDDLEQVAETDETNNTRQSGEVIC
jgi:hypothetical protein